MEISAELIEAALTAITAFFAGGGLSYQFWRKKAGQITGQAGGLVENMTTTELLQILFELNKALKGTSPGGGEITAQEAEALGRAAWSALKSKN